MVKLKYVVKIDADIICSKSNIIIVKFYMIKLKYMVERKLWSNIISYINFAFHHVFELLNARSSMQQIIIIMVKIQEDPLHNNSPDMNLLVNWTNVTSTES